MVSEQLRRRISNIQLIVFDFDGVFTDGKVIVDQDGRESVVCSRKDTLRFPELKVLGIHLVVISKERNPVVAKRCEKMKVECLQGVDDKLAAFKRLLETQGLSSEQAAFMGDDINDLVCLEFTGVAFTVADGDEQCQTAADYVTSRKGGDHAVREVCDVILESRQQ